MELTRVKITYTVNSCFNVLAIYGRSTRARTAPSYNESNTSYIKYHYSHRAFSSNETVMSSAIRTGHAVVGERVDGEIDGEGRKGGCWRRDASGDPNRNLLEYEV